MVKKYFSKKSLIIVLLIITILTAIHFIFFSSVGLRLYNDKDKVIFSDLYSRRSAIVTENGCVYVNGEKNDASYRVLGIKKIRRFENLFNFFKENSFVCIYDSGDASEVYLSYSGGAIITKNNEAYIFCSSSEEYYIPKLFMKNVKCAIPVDECVYILTVDGTFGFCRLENPAGFVPLMKSIISFKVMTDSNEIITLSETGQLSVAEYGEGFAGSFDEMINDVSGFSAVQYHIDAPTVSVGIVDRNGNLLRYDMVGSFSVSKALSSQPEELGKNIKMVAVYSDGTVAINQNRDLIVYGKDFGFDDRIFNGEVLCKNCRSVSSSSDKVIVVKSDGTISCYGYTTSQMYLTFAK